MPINPLYISRSGGTINSYKGDTGWLYRVCSKQICFYCSDITAAKAHLDKLERTRSLTKAERQLKANRNWNSKALNDLVELAAAPYLEKEAV